MPIVVGHEPHPILQGLRYRWYAKVVVFVLQGGWAWQLEDITGSLIGAPSTVFATEDDARTDAINTLGGDYWQDDEQ
ncbi:hypothetical protein LMG24235_08623 [Paraburkholderia sabiae]|nr:hypothetical protein LMG24235_08623 [Paraburkholderia sabiae]